VTHHGSEGIVPSAAPQEWDALAPGQPARMGNEHRWNAQRVLPDLIWNISRGVRMERSFQAYRT